MLTKPQPHSASLANGNGQTLLLHGISWQSYQQISRALPDKSLHLTYDRGTLELMVLGTAHERFKSLIGLLIFVLAEELKPRDRQLWLVHTSDARSVLRKLAAGAPNASLTRRAKDALARLRPN